MVDSDSAVWVVSVVDFVAAVWDVVVALVVVVDGVPCSPLFLLESQQWVPLLVFP